MFIPMLKSGKGKKMSFLQLSAIMSVLFAIGATLLFFKVFKNDLRDLRWWEHLFVVFTEICMAGCGAIIGFALSIFLLICMS